MADVALIKCHGCRRIIRVPDGPLRSAMRELKKYVRFCSRKCQVKYVATTGAAQQQGVPNA